MLSEEEKCYIREQELYRLETQKTLASRQVTSISKTIAFLNSNLGIWFLSSIIVGVLGFSFSLLSNHISTMNKNRTLYRATIVEVSVRLGRARSQLSTNITTKNQLNRTSTILDGLTKGGASLYVEPSMKNMTLRYLLTRLSSLSGSCGKKALQKLIISLESTSNEAPGLGGRPYERDASANQDKVNLVRNSLRNSIRDFNAYSNECGK